MIFNEKYPVNLQAINNTLRMARIGYLWNTPHYKYLEEDKQWMLDNGCEQIIEEQNIHEKLRPEWQRLIEALTTSDELVVGKFSNAVRGARELSILLEFCRKNMVRVISIRDRIDSTGEMFKDTRSSDILNMMATLPQEALAMRRANRPRNELNTESKINACSGASGSPFGSGTLSIIADSISFIPTP